MKRKPDTRPRLRVPLAHVLIYWIPLSLLLWALILFPLFYLFTGRP